MKKIISIILLFLAASFGYGQINDLIISEYGEGSTGNDKYIELFNGTGADVDLSDYRIWRVSNGGTWPEATITLSGILTNGSTYVISHPSANATIVGLADLTSFVVAWNGDDAAGLAKDDGTGTFNLIDAVGTDGLDPGTGWDVAGITNATVNNTMSRKSSICSTNTDWATSAGTTVLDSEWIVNGVDDWTDIGNHTTECCVYSTTWSAGSWSNGNPSVNTIVTIDDDYDTANGGLETSFSACNLIVNNGATLNINDYDYIEVQNDLNVDTGGTITVQPYGAFIQNSDSGSVTNSGLIQVAKETAPLDNWYEYTYWSSPVSGARVEDVLSDSDENRRFIFIAQNFLDATAETANDNTTIAGQDDIDDNGDDWQWVNGTTVMQPGVGYAATHSEIALPIPGASYRYTFEGPFNNGVVNIPVYRNDGSEFDKNWNLIGNPYPSAIDIDAFMTQNLYNVSTNPSGTLEGAIYFWSQNTDYSSTTNGNQALNFDTTDYATHNGTGGTVGGDGLTPNGFIPSGQAFFVSFSEDAPSNTGNVVFNNAMRSLSLSPDNSQFFKGLNSKKNSTSNDNKLWIDLTSDNGVFNQILVGYIENATDDDDGAYYDANKIVAPKAFSALYSSIEGSDKKFVIQGKATNSLNEDETINLGFSTNIDVPTLYKLSIAKLQGAFLANNVIYLKDNLLNKLHDLSSSDYTFTSEVGVFNSRFEIVFNALALSTDEHIFDNKALKIVDLENDRVQFNVSDNLSIKTVNIYDLLGRQLYNLDGNSSTETYNLSKLNNAIYIAKVELSSGAVITKKALKK